MEVIFQGLPFNNNLSVKLPTRCESVLKFKDRVIELNISLISDDSFTFSDNSFDEHAYTMNSETKLPNVTLDIGKCFVMRKSSPASGPVAETPRTSTPLSEDTVSDSRVSSSSLQSSRPSTSKDTKKYFICGICKKKFVFERRFKNHMLTHQDGTMTNLKNKMDATTDEKNKECGFCGKRFKWKCDVRKHVKSVHMPNTMHTCDHCPKFFWSSSGLRDHRISRHAMVLGLVCKGCEKKFRTKNQINSHMELFPDHATASVQLKR